MGHNPIPPMGPPRRRTRRDEEDARIEQAKRVYVDGHCTFEQFEEYVDLLLRTPVLPTEREC